MSSNPEEKCFCPTNTTCLPKGVMDLNKCMKAPIYCTLPHFLETDEQLLTQVEGLHPEEDKHHILIFFEPVMFVLLVNNALMTENVIRSRLN